MLLAAHVFSGARPNAQRSSPSPWRHLVEFQSNADAWMALRIMVYAALLCPDLIKAGEVAAPGRLPAVFRIVICNGEPA